LRKENSLISDAREASDCLLNKSLLAPIEYPNLIRLGTKGDGGYVVPEDQVADCELLISLGLSDNWEFDKEFLAKNPAARVIGVDHTVGRLWFQRRVLLYSWKIFMNALLCNPRKVGKYIDKWRNNLEYFSFFKKPNIHLKRKISPNSDKLDISLGEILDSNPAQNIKLNVFLKMDIEGSEYGTMKDIIRCHNRIRCVAAEFHDLDKRTAEFNDCMQVLSQYFSVVHIHGNNGASYDPVNDFPSVVEITLVNKTLLKAGSFVSLSEYPRPGLDFPNNPGVPDYRLRFK
jgi:hypothetical protein